MTRKLEGWAGKARRLESAIGSRVERATRAITGSTTRQPLEIVHAVVDAIEHECPASGRGQRVAPFTRVRVSLLAETPRDRVRLQAACDGPPTLQARIEERLAQVGCTAPGLTLKVVFVATAKEGWTQPEFHLDYTREAPAPPPVATTPASPPRLDLSVTHGSAAKARYSSEGATVALGRGEDVRDSHRRLIRTNHIAFVEGASDVNQSVSRRHARIDYDPAARAYRLHDESGAGATSVIRDGRGLRVPHGRGLRLQPADVIVLGEARVLVKIQ